jgi:hypothetical protein
VDNLPVWTLAAMMSEVGYARATGGMRVTAEDGQRLVFFEDGAIVYFVSDCRDDALGAFLARSERFATDEMRAPLSALEERVSRSHPLVTLVLAEGLCTSEELRPLLVEHMVECMGRLFARHDTSPRFLAGVRANHPLSFVVPPGAVIVEATRHMDDVEAVRAAVGPLSHLASPAEDHFSRLASAPLGYAEGAIGALVTEEIALEDLIALCGLSEEQALRALLALRLVGVLDPFVEPKQITESGRLRRRLSALEEGRAVDMEAALIGTASASPDGEAAPAEVEARPARVEAPQPASRPNPAPLAPSARRSGQGESGKLRMLASAYVQMARAEADRGNVGGAVKYFREALAQRPDDHDTLLAFADVLRARPGGESAAEELLKRACAAHRTSVSARVAYVEVLRSIGNTERADEVMDEIARLDPGQARKARGGAGLMSKMRSFAGFAQGARERK